MHRSLFDEADERVSGSGSGRSGPAKSPNIGDRLGEGNKELLNGVWTAWFCWIASLSFPFMV